MDRGSHHDRHPTTAGRCGVTGEWPAWMSSPDLPCRGRTAMFVTFDRESRQVRESRVRRAKKLCSVCPHLAECRAWGLAHLEEYGIYGGLTETERRLFGDRGKRCCACDTPVTGTHPSASRVLCGSCRTWRQIARNKQAKAKRRGETAA